MAYSSLKLRFALLRRLYSMHSRRRVEQSFVVAYIRDELGELGSHPSRPYVVNAGWPHATIDDPELPSDWIKQAARECNSVLRQYPWTLSEPNRTGTASREALEAVGRLLCDVQQWAGVGR